MKKLFSLMLILLLLPCTFLVTGCGDKGYKLSKVSPYITEMADKYQSVKMQDEKLVFTYEEYLKDEDKYIENLINTTRPYSYLKDYNMLYDNLMDFTFTYLPKCANDNIEVDEVTRNKLEKSLKDFDQNLNWVDINTREWADNVKVASGDVTTSVICLSKFNDLLVSYEDLFDSANNINDIMADVYFDHALEDSNTNYHDMSFSNFDAGMVINKLDARIKYQKSVLTKLYIEMHLSGRNVSETLVAPSLDFGTLNLNAYGYSSNINKINRAYNIDNSITVANNKEEFYNVAIEMYNAQTIIADNEKAYNNASKNIVYTTDSIKANPTLKEEVNLDIIEHQYNVIIKYNAVLDRVLTLMGV